MLTIFGQRQQFCDGMRRRDFLRIGALTGGAMAFGGTLADVMRAEAGMARPGQKSVINIFLRGGPSHLDLFDLKPDAPAEIRGEFKPTATNVPGVEINSLFQRLSKQADKFSIIRSLAGMNNEHGASQTETGFREMDLKSSGGHPSLGAVVSKLHGTTNGSVPRFVDLSGQTFTGFLGSVYAGFRPDAVGRGNLTLGKDLTLERIADRAKLLKKMDTMRRDLDNGRLMEAMDSFNQRAIDVITGQKLANALRTDNEDARVKERYGLNSSGNGDAQPFLLSRKLIQAGVRIVSLAWGGWDNHAGIFSALKNQIPKLDVGLSGLIADLDELDMLRDTIVVMWGEFGRTPRVNPGAGRDHWSRASSCFIAGGGMKMGQVIGSTNRYGETPQDRPVDLHEVFATLYSQLGINAKETTINDHNGRPQYLAPNNPNPIAELIG